MKITGRIISVLKNTSRSRIFVYGALVTCTAIMVAYLLLVAPITELMQSEKSREILIENKLNSLQSEQALILDNIPESAELPAVLSFLKDSLETNGAIISEIQTTQLSAQERNGFKQAGIRIALMGDKRDIIGSIGGILRDSGYPLILEEIDTSNNNTAISLKILYK